MGHAGITKLSEIEKLGSDGNPGSGNGSATARENEGRLQSDAIIEPSQVSVPVPVPDVLITPVTGLPGDAHTVVASCGVVMLVVVLTLTVPALIIA